MNRVLIIGCKGFIGSHLSAFFLQQGFEVHGCDVLDADHEVLYYHKVSDDSSVEHIIRSFEFDFCINAAGSGNVSLSISNPHLDFNSNVVNTFNILDIIRKHNSRCRYLHISSAAVYGNPCKLPVQESSDPAPVSPYGWHKLMSEQLCQEYHNLYNVPVAIVRPFSVYGEGLRKQLFWDLCCRLQTLDHIELFGTGKESRDFIHVQDLCYAIELITKQSAFEGNIYNIASGEETMIKDVVSYFQNCYPVKKKISFTGQVKIGDPKNWQADIGKLQKIGFNPVIKIQEGIEGYVSWFLKEGYGE